MSRHGGYVSVMKQPVNKIFYLCQHTDTGTRTSTVPFNNAQAACNAWWISPQCKWTKQWKLSLAANTCLWSSWNQCKLCATNQKKTIGIHSAWTWNKNLEKKKKTLMKAAKLNKINILNNKHQRQSKHFSLEAIMQNDVVYTIFKMKYRCRILFTKLCSFLAG